jgi:membrane fusion protein (multidrug efflux system)
MARTIYSQLRRRALPVLCLSALGLALAGCGGKSEGKEEGKAKDALNGTTREEKVNVAVETMTAHPFFSRLLLVGEVQAENDAVISAQSGGTLRRVVADRGSRVRAGDTLLVLDSRRYQAAFDAAEAQAANARLDYEMADRLHKNGQGVSDNDWKKAQNGLKMTEAALANARIDLENCFITAPQGGTVAERFVDLGELVGPGSPLLQVVQGELKVRCGLPENQTAGAKRGMTARVRVPEAGVDAQAQVAWVGSVLDGGSRTLPLELRLKNAAGLHPGMACQVELDRPRGALSVVVPLTVVQNASDTSYVFIEEGGLAARRVVTLGERNGERVEVLTGLKAGDRLIVSGYRGLSQGQALAVIAPKAGEQAGK